MRYAAVDAPLSVSIREEDVSSTAAGHDLLPGPGEIVVKSILSGISAGTEMAVYRGTLSNLHTKRWGYWTEYPVRPGYQLVGMVEQCGQGVKGVGPGD